MTRFDLPPLSALRAFEAAARHLNLTRAARELSVTQGAVSRQIKRLEEHVGLKLFARKRDGVELTPPGRVLFLQVQDSFRRVAERLAEIRAQPRRQIVTVTASPFFAARWLMPRLAGFERMHPEIEIRIRSSARRIDLEREGIDLGIRYGTGDWPRLDAVKLLTEEVFPVCSPRLLNDKPLANPQDLRRHVLLHNVDTEGWRRWLEVKGDGEIALEGPVFDDCTIMLRAAMSGRGVGLARSLLVEEELSRGQLVRPLPPHAARQLSCYVVTPRDAQSRAEVQLFKNWLQAEAGLA